MKKISFVLSMCMAFLGGRSQGRIQAGVTALPVFDFLNLYPSNTIRGLAIAGNFGTFYTPNISFGINPFAAGATNNFVSPQFNTNSNLLLYGLNSYFRYYMAPGKRYRIYTHCAAGLAHLRVRTIFSTTLSHGFETVSEAATSFMGGLGANYFLSKNLALELNFSYVLLINVLSTPPVLYFQTVAPTFGLQFFLEGSRQEKLK